MRKQRKFRILILAFAAMILLYVSNDFSLLSVRQASLVAAVGIDLAEDGYEITAQIAVPQADENGGKNKQVTVSARAKTAEGALRIIGHSCGWYPVMSFCSVVLLGEEAAKRNVMPVLDYFVRERRMQDAASLAVCQGTAKEVLQSVPPLDDLTSFTLEKIFQVNELMVFGVNSVSVKEFAESYYEKGSGGFAPFIVKKKAGEDGFSALEMPDLDGDLLTLPSRGTREVPFSENEKKTDPSGEKSGENGEKQGEETVYDASLTMLFREGKGVAVLDPRQTLARGLLVLPGKESLFPVYGAEGVGFVMLGVLSDKSSLRLTVENGVPKAWLSVHLTVKTEASDRLFSRVDEDLVARFPEGLRQAAEKQLTEYYEDVFALCRAAQCDFFGLLPRLYRHYPEKYREISETFFERLQVAFDVSVQSAGSV